LFGYVKAFKPNMRMCEYESYRAVYCSLCRELGRTYGPLARLTLNYDFAFLAVLGISLEKEFCGFKKTHCVFNPMVRCHCTQCMSESLNYSTAAAMIMLYYKFKDDIADKGFFACIPKLLFLPLVSHTHKKALKKYPEIEQFVKAGMERQVNLEKDNCSSIDRAADPTAEILSKLFSKFASSEEEKRILQRFGYCMGRWIYIIDAVDDLNDDIKSNNYNPLILAYNVKECSFPLPEDLNNRLTESLNVCISEAACAFALLKTKRFDEILKNIICEGMPQVQKEVLKKHGEVFKK